MSVAFDAVGPSSAGTAKTVSVSGSDTLTWSHTCSGSNRLLVVGIGAGIDGSNDANASVSVTYNGVSLTSAGRESATGSGFSQLFYLVNPPTGTHTVSVSINITSPSGTSTIEGGSISFTGVDQTTPVRNAASASGGSNMSSVTITSAVGNMVVDIGVFGSNITASSQTQRWGDNFSGHTGAGNAAQSTANGASSVTMGYSNTGIDEWSIVAADVVAAASGSTFSDSISVAATTALAEANKATLVGAAAIAASATLTDSNKYTAKPSVSVSASTGLASTNKATLVGAAALSMTADFSSTFGGLVSAAINLAVTSEISAANAALVSALLNVGATSGFALGTQLDANASAAIASETVIASIGNTITTDLISLGLTTDVALAVGKLLQEAISLGLNAAINGDATVTELVVAAVVAEAVRVVHSLSAEEVRVLQSLVAESVRTLI